MADNCTTPEFRGTFVAVLRPSAGKNDDGTPGKLKYSIRAAFPPTADLSGLKAMAGLAAQEKWGDKIPKGLRNPFRTYGELDKEFDGIDEDWVLMTFSTNAEHKPGVVTGMVRDADGRPTDLTNEDDVYSGAWFQAIVRASAYENAGNKGVTFYLQHVMKTRDDKPLAGARIPANAAFEAVANASPQGAPSRNAAKIFD